ncbi:3-deoxy-manno-octulosonate cytidylyltransferase [Fusobacterium varium]|nr:glycosyltransferase family protein [Fusobacterium varium]VEH38305.1 3-deoxy-manno-octulosonate cytidylyltransferase [Fusobacterium varium]
MNIVCIIQARTTSSRLPNKVLLNLPYNGDKTVLEQVINRVKESKYINKIVVATTINETDNKIEKLCESLQISCFRGSEDNVLSRYYEAATKYKADLIIRITSDCPCIDYEIMDKLIEFHLNNNNDFSSNNQIHSFPHGLDCEIVNYNVLVEAFKNATEKYEKEHVMPYIYISNPNKYKLGILKDKNNNHDIRITLDTKEDYILLCLVYDFLYENDNFFNKDKIIKLFQEKSYLYEINKNIEQKKYVKI